MPIRNVAVGLINIHNSRIVTTDEKGPGEAYHEYEISSASDLGFITQRISFQKGALKDNKRNGIFIEDLLTICMDRLSCFQDGPGNCGENSKAIVHIHEALSFLKDRTHKRVEQGVEGTDKSHKS